MKGRLLKLKLKQRIDNDGGGGLMVVMVKNLQTQFGVTVKCLTDNGRQMNALPR